MFALWGVLFGPSGYPNPLEPRSFWRDALGWRQAVTRQVLPNLAVFGLHGALVGLLHSVYGWSGIPATHVSFAGGALGLLLVLRTNGGYERWWEARKLWGGIVNQCRNFAIKAVAWGQTDAWIRQVVSLTAAFPHACRQQLRGVRVAADFEPLLGAEAAAALVASEHMPSHVALRLAVLVQQGRAEKGIDDFGFLELDRERAALIDHLGGCERILKTPMPRVHSIKLRRFILLYLLGLPFAVASSSPVLSAVVTMLVSYPMLAIDRIAQELENPFQLDRASHLPLDTICETIQRNVLALLPPVKADPPPPAAPPA